jgi:hypothetical protein
MKVDQTGHENGVFEYMNAMRRVFLHYLARRTRSLNDATTKNHGAVV